MNKLPNLRIILHIFIKVYVLPIIVASSGHLYILFIDIIRVEVKNCRSIDIFTLNE